MEIKNVLCELRKKQGLSQDEMAARLFVTRQAVSRWENGETIPSIDMLKKMAEIFDVSIGRFLGIEDNKLCLLKQDEFMFSYRVAGILIHDGKVLLQKPKSTGDYAFPGGHVIFGETTPETLVRRWREETGMDIEVGELKWVEENLFMWGNKPCQQISLSYIVKPKGETALLLADGLTALTYSEDDENAVCFYWIPLGEVKNITVYPVQAAELLRRLDEPLQRIVYWEEEAKK